MLAVPVTRFTKFIAHFLTHTPGGNVLIDMHYYDKYKQFSNHVYDQYVV
jgi:hypothetical protein